MSPSLEQLLAGAIPSTNLAPEKSVSPSINQSQDPSSDLFFQFSLLEVLQPAIDLAEEGYPVAPIAAYLWEEGAAELRNPSNAHGRDMLLPDGNPPRAGDIMKMPHLAATFKVRVQNKTKHTDYDLRILKDKHILRLRLSQFEEMHSNSGFF